MRAGLCGTDQGIWGDHMNYWGVGAFVIKSTLFFPSQIFDVDNCPVCWGVLTGLNLGPKMSSIITPKLSPETARCPLSIQSPTQVETTMSTPRSPSLKKCLEGPSTTQNSISTILSVVQPILVFKINFTTVFLAIGW